MAFNLTLPVNPKEGSPAKIIVTGAEGFRPFSPVTFSLEITEPAAPPAPAVSVENLDLGAGWFYNVAAARYEYTVNASAEGKLPANTEIPVTFPVVDAADDRVVWSDLTVAVGADYLDTDGAADSWVPASPADAQITVKDIPWFALEAASATVNPGAAVTFTLTADDLEVGKGVTITLDDGAKYDLAGTGFVMSGSRAIWVLDADDISDAQGVGGLDFSVKPKATAWTADGGISISVVGGGVTGVVSNTEVSVLGTGPQLSLKLDGAETEIVADGVDSVTFDLGGRNLTADGFVTVTLAGALNFFESESALRVAGWVLAADGSATRIFTAAAVEAGRQLELTPNKDFDWAAGGTAINLSVTGGGVTTTVFPDKAVTINPIPAGPPVTLTPQGDALSVVEGYEIVFDLKGEELNAGEDVTVTLSDALNFFKDVAAVAVAGWELAANGTATRTFTVQEDGTVEGTVKITPNATHDWTGDAGLKLSVTGAGITRAVEQEVKVTLRRPDVPGGDDIVDIHIAADGETTTVFPDKLADYGLTWANGTVYVEGTGAAIDEFVGFQRIQLADGVIDLETPSWLFDPVFYAVNNADVYASKVGSFEHFEQIGNDEGRDANAFFNAKGYLAVNKDVAAANVTAADHYLEVGAAEGRDTAINFDVRLYLQNNEDVARAGVSALEHFLKYGQIEGRATYIAIGETIEVDAFDEQYYLFANADVVAAGVDARTHFAEYGYNEGRFANAFFDPAYYLEQNADVKQAGIDPLSHYNEFGWREGRAASAEFNTEVYLDNYADVAAADINPLKHYLEFGIYENRSLDDIHNV